MKNYDILKMCCSKVFMVGSGNFWFEENTIGDDKSLLYRLYTSLLFFLYVFMTVLEIMAIFMGDFPDDEKRDCITFAVSHTIVIVKLFLIVTNKEVIKKLNKKMIEVCELHEEEMLMAAKYRIIKINIIAYASIVYGSAMCFVFEGLRKLHEGSHFVTIVTYYPVYEDNSIPATAVRIFTTVILYVMMMSMIITVDGLTMLHLIIYKYKFITLRNYFEKLAEEFKTLNIPGNTKEAAERLSRGIIEGIIMHSEVLSISKDIDKAFGTVLALQLCLSSGSAVSLLLQIALSDQLTFVASMKIIFFVVALFFLLGLFLCNAGEITYQYKLTIVVLADRLMKYFEIPSYFCLQASLLSDAIFYCGWHACPPNVDRKNIRKIVLLAIVRAQRPLVMKAFKMLELTYATFLLVVRSTYSVFALLYAQNE